MWTRPPPELLVITRSQRRRKRSLAAATELLIPHTERRTLPMELLVTRSQRSTRRRRSVRPLTTEGNVEVQTTLSRRTTSTLAVTVSLTTGDSGVVGSHLVLIQSSTHMDTKRSRKRESVTSD